jgi:hypothetical protein
MHFNYRSFALSPQGSTGSGWCVKCHMPILCITHSTATYSTGEHV